MREGVEKVRMELGVAMNLVMQADCHRKAQDAESMSKAMTVASDVFMETIRPATQALGSEFRQLLLGQGWGD
jgi:hypothetical protein